MDTYADVDDLVEQFGYKPNTSVEDGIKKFVDWFNCLLYTSDAADE